MAAIKGLGPWTRKRLKEKGTLDEWLADHARHTAAGTLDEWLAEQGVGQTRQKASKASGQKARYVGLAEAMASLPGLLEAARSRKYTACDYSELVMLCEAMDAASLACKSARAQLGTIADDLAREMELKARLQAQETEISAAHARIAELEQQLVVAGHGGKTGQRKGPKLAAAE